MRFTFADESHDDERSARERVISESAAIASLLARDASQAHGVCVDRVRAAISERVRRIDSRIDVEVIDDHDGTAGVIALSARGERTLCPLVEAIVACAAEAAAARDGLRIVAGKPPASVEAARARVKQELDFDLEDCRVRAGFARGHLLELVVYASAFASSEDERALDAGELAVLTLLGERVFDDWIGEVRVAPLPRKSLLRVLGNEPIEERTHPLAGLSDVVGTAVQGIVDGLPDQPLWQSTASEEWTMFELEPELSFDYAAQDDLAIATTRAPELLKCFLRGQPFSSLRFSRFGERFCYLKLDGDGQRSEERLFARRAIEDALSEALPDTAAGAVIGNGLGVRYAYVDLALANLSTPVERVVEIARAAKAPRRSWLLFCDGDLAAEWVGVWPDTPSPF